MDLLLDTVNDALRPLPGSAPVLRRSAAGPADLPPDDMGDSADPSALTVYRLQKEGGTPPPAAPLHGPSTIGQGAFHRAAGPDGVVNSIDHPLVSLKDGLERGEKITREVHGQEALSNRQFESSSVSPALSGAQSHEVAASVSHLAETSDEEIYPDVANAPAQRHYGKIGGSRVAGGAPSEDLLVTPAEPSGIDNTAPAKAQPGSRANAAVRETSARQAASARAQTQVQATAQSAPEARGPGSPSLARRTPARHAPESTSGLHIGRIEVTVLAQAPRPAPRAAGQPPVDSQFLSRNYLRRT
ncbi:hypothetical protein [Variovorax saccharolyticus]|uniref:hypothetical protein n=1 Tax=Variovorax saccharolyticus TaxID=3053516 RepID=UPI002577FCDA|nr:hypothetical protein [Variovorax sp. J31P216]MDM0030050.1 hypothetical protein [Variovorax sp. J31P216]